MTTRRALRCLALTLSTLLFLFGGGFAGCGSDDSTPTGPADAAVGHARTDATTDSGGCPTGQTACGASCVDLQSDSTNCKTCGTVCGTGTDCEQGACVAPCLVGQTRCNGRCIALETDNANCGTCGTVCSTGLVCNGGSCDVACAPPLTTCEVGGADAGTAAGLDAGADAATDAAVDAAVDAGGASDAGDAGNAADGATDAAPDAAVSSDAGEPTLGRYCARTASDENNCGACGVTCGSGKQCDDGVCSDTCSIGQTLCSGVCRDLATDLANCGTCGTACPSGQVCSGGVCQASCGMPFTLCGSACANTASDPTHCGSCSTSCSPANVKAPACSSGTCNYVGCQSGYADCDGNTANGCELPTSSDPTNCGGCGVHCAGANVVATTCAGGACGYTGCQTGHADCDGNAANGCEADLGSTSSCGACGKTCVAGGTCDNQGCVAPPSAIYPDLGASATLPRAQYFTIDSPAPSVIYYTEDGSIPTLSSPKLAPSPFTVTLPFTGTSATLRWISYDGATVSGVQSRTIIENTALATTQDWIIVELVRLSLTSGGSASDGPAIVVPGGTTVYGTLRYELADNGCPDCVDELVVGVTSPQTCIYNGIPGVWGGAEGSGVAFTVTAPTTPGVYPVRMDFEQQGSCGQAMTVGAPHFASGVAQAIGEIIVP